MIQPDRSYSSGGYRYGFNGKENDNEVKGDGNQQDYGMRVYDPRVGRFLSIDPLTAKYPQSSPYLYSLNSPILFIDNEGLDARISIIRNKDGGGTIKIQTVVHILPGNDFYINAKESLLERYNGAAKIAFKGGDYKDSNGNNWKITFDVKYVVDEQIGGKMTTLFKPGDNYMSVWDQDPEIKDGRAITKGMYIHNTRKGQGDSYTTTHETGHSLGLTDRYSSFSYLVNKKFKDASISHDGYETNLMGGSGFDINQDQLNNWGEFILNKAVELKRDIFILNEKVEYRYDEAGRNLRHPYTEASKERIDALREKLTKQEESKNGN